MDSNVYALVEYSTPGSEPNDTNVQNGVAGWLARGITPIVAVSPTSPGYGDFVGALDPAVILGVKCSNVLLRIDDVAGWTTIANFIKAVSSNGGGQYRKHFFEMETILATTYYTGGLYIDFNNVREGLMQLPRLTESMLYPAFYGVSAASADEYQLKMMTLASAVRQVLPYSRMVTHKLAKPQDDNSWWSVKAEAVNSRFDTINAPSVSTFYIEEYASVQAHPFWAAAKALLGLSTAELLGQDVIFVPNFASFYDPACIDLVADAMDLVGHEY